MAVQRRHDGAESAIQPGDVVRHGDGHPGRRAVRITCDFAYAAHGFAHHAITRWLTVRAILPIATDAHEDEPGVGARELVVPHAPALKRAGPEMLDNDVGLLAYPADNVEPFLEALVDGNDSLCSKNVHGV